MLPGSSDDGLQLVQLQTLRDRDGVVAIALRCDAQIAAAATAVGLASAQAIYQDIGKGLAQRRDLAAQRYSIIFVWFSASAPSSCCATGSLSCCSAAINARSFCSEASLSSTPRDILTGRDGVSATHALACRVKIRDVKRGRGRQSGQ